MKTTTLQQLKEKLFKDPEFKRAYDNETLDIKDVEVKLVRRDQLNPISLNNDPLSRLE